MSEEKIIRYFIGDREVSWNEYVRAEGPGKFAWKECDHQGYYRVIGGNCIALRWCTNCGKSWRMPTQGDYLFGDHPVAEWEPIKEGLEVEQRILPDYEE